MHRTLALLPLALLASCGTGLPPSPVLPVAEVQRAVDAANARIGAAMARGDAAAVAALFTQDAAVLYPTIPGFQRGRPAIEELYRRLLAGTRFLEVSLTTVSLDVRGDLAVEIGASSALVQAGGAESVRRTGRYVGVWRKDADGVWRILVDAPVPDPER